MKPKPTTKTGQRGNPLNPRQRSTTDRLTTIRGAAATEFNQQAALLLLKIAIIGARHSRKLVIPNAVEWVGLNVMERDHDLHRFFSQENGYAQK